MNSIQKVIYVGFAGCMLAAASVPALSWAVSPAQINYNSASMGNRANIHRVAPSTSFAPAPVEDRPGYKWVPGTLTSDGTRDYTTSGVWIRDDASPHWLKFQSGDSTIYANGPLNLKDSQGNTIPIDPSAYPLDATRR